MDFDDSIYKNVGIFFYFHITMVINRLYFGDSEQNLRFELQVIECQLLNINIETQRNILFYDK